ncbi:biotin--[acetyl-CoA-carboxylase] ligase [Marinomonas sp. PE14-40]|uniref:biotin--[acetyl-CoA-carboxylase] ligase n=1 Tax=Marinomonas sp. PE14-40 TaxID=3060621 RepID=UPI003F66AB60
MRDLLLLLADSQFHSGEELGEALGVTRAAIWKKLKKLETLGIKLHSVKGRGYRLPHEIELLDQAQLDGVGLDVPIKVCFETKSTNDDVKKHIASGAELPVAVATEIQNQGKGRRGRQWQGGVAKNIMMSFGWRFDNGISVVEGLSLAVGAVVARVLKKHGVESVGLKWPNDVQVEGRKICGILLEMVADQDICDVIIGVGLNVSMSEQDMTEVDQPWTDVMQQTSHKVSRNQILADLVSELEIVCKTFEQGDGLAAYLTEWMQQDVLKNQPVKMTSGKLEELGVARGIDAKGALLFEQDGIVKALHGGEVSVRKQ